MVEAQHARAPLNSVLLIRCSVLCKCICMAVMSHEHLIMGDAPMLACELPHLSVACFYCVLLFLYGFFCFARPPSSHIGFIPFYFLGFILTTINTGPLDLFTFAKKIIKLFYNLTCMAWLQFTSII